VYTLETGLKESKMDGVKWFSTMELLRKDSLKIMSSKEAREMLLLLYHLLLSDNSFLRIQFIQNTFQTTQLKRFTQWQHLKIPKLLCLKV